MNAHFLIAKYACREDTEARKYEARSISTQNMSIPMQLFGSRFSSKDAGDSDSDDYDSEDDVSDEDSNEEEYSDDERERRKQERIKAKQAKKEPPKMMFRLLVKKGNKPQSGM